MSRPFFLCATIAALAFAWGCSRGPTPAEPPPLGDVVREAIARLEAELGPPPPAPKPIEAEHAFGLAEMLASTRGREREIPRDEVATLGACAVAPLVALARDEAREPDVRAAAIELLAVAGDASAARALAALVREGSEPWVRAHAAWRLTELTDDAVLPDLLLRLRYETFEQPLAWVARALGARRNWSGARPLLRLAEDAHYSEEERADALAHAAELARQAGAPDALTLARLWEAGDPEERLPRPQPSTALRLAVWRRIAALSGEHFQLRGVDDARYVLSHLGAWAAEPLAAALRDRDVYVRVHSAQCLERMGPRGLTAGPALVASLGDPALAPQAARALGAIGWSGAEPALRRCLRRDCSHELRVAAARALGHLALPASRSALLDLIDPREPKDLRLAACEALVAMGAGDAVAAELLGFLRDPAADREAAEAALGRWLSGRTDPEARELLAQWERLGQSDTYPAPTREEVEARIAARLRLVETALARRGPAGD